MRPQIFQQLQTLEGICGTVFVQETIELFLSESETRLIRLGTVLAEGDLAEARQLFHKLQGSAASIDALRLRRLCALGEEASLGDHRERAERIFELCVTEMERLKPSFLTWKQP